MTRTICSKCAEPVVSGGLCRKHYDKKRYADRGTEIIRDGVPTPRLSQIAVGAVRPNKYEVRSMALELARSRRGLPR